MKVTRKVTFKTKEIRVGDQINVNLRGFRTFTATAQKITDDAVLFLFDECVVMRPMNELRTNIGGFNNSDLKRWLNTVILPALPEYLRCRITDIAIPSYGEIFGYDEYYENFEPDNDIQFELMKQGRNRISYFNGLLYPYWLRNATKKDISETFFAYVNYNGNAYCRYASASHGVRLEFWLKK